MSEEKQQPMTRQGTWRRIREATIAKISLDLLAGEVSVHTTDEELTRRYGRDVWREYKEALWDYGYDHGCLVLVDDANDGRYVAMMEHFDRDISPEEARAYFAAPIAEYIRRTEAAEAEGLPENVVLLRLPKRRSWSVYRLPFGDYSGETKAFFEDRGEFIWQSVAKG
jgi:hypothetical protein